MNLSDEISVIKFKNVIDMAITFTAMNRIFEKGTKKKIVQRLENSFSKFMIFDGKDSFESIHLEFCEWFTKNVSTAEKKLKNKKNKKSQAASYGHAAKVFDIAVKVYVYYCHLPSCDLAAKLLPVLHGAVDTPILTNLKKKYPSANIKAETIEALGKSEYDALQKLVAKHIEDDFQNAIHPVQYDDIMWHRLNRLV